MIVREIAAGEPRSTAAKCMAIALQEVHHAMGDGDHRPHSSLCCAPEQKAWQAAVSGVA